MAEKNRGFRKVPLVVCVFIAAIVSILHPQPEEAPNTATVNFMGDVRLDSYVYSKILQRGYEYPFGNIRDILDNADINCLNLECAVSRLGTKQDKEYTFRAAPEALNVFKESKVNLAVVANNHSYDYGEEAFLDTLKNLEDYGIKHLGGGVSIDQARKPAVFEIGNLKIAFLAYSNMFPKEQWANKGKSGVVPAYLEYIKNDVTKAAKHADFVFVIYHGGIERSYDVKKVQRDIAYTAIDAGACAVIGHHSHRLGKFEFYKERLICYSLGNFLFLSKDKESYKTMILQAEIVNGKLSFCFFPLVIADAFVRKPTNEEFSSIYELLKSISDDQAVGLAPIGQKIIISQKR